MALKRILRYLNGSKDLGIVYSKNANENLKGYSDADWAGDSIDRRSTSGYIFCMNGGPVSWKSQKQKSVALSTVESEYMALSAASQECAG